MRLNQFISSSGYCSRRQADKYIRAGKVLVNGNIAEVGLFITPDDIVEISGEIIKPRKRDIYLILHKPQGITSTAAEHIEGNIIDFINYPERIFPVGRLDKQSEGLILLTNDGSIVNGLLQGENSQEKDYIVTVDKAITTDFIKNMAAGVNIYNPRKKAYTLTNPCPVVQIDAHRFKITLVQGLNRQIRRMCRNFQYTVTRLQRTRLKHLTLDGLEVGQWRHLTTEEIEELK